MIPASTSSRILLLAITPLCALAEPAHEPWVSTARADGQGHIAVHLVYFAEDTCISFASVREGAPPSIEAPRKTPTVTVVLTRGKGPECKQKLKTLEQLITITDWPKALSVEVLYIDRNGVFVRSSRPPIERPGVIDQEIE